ncbi:hypothetical protein QJQ45_029211 [Haematococcus lacustris]|nr:hypothetical protein QJQ45_029211 [Haematococcus lacustris]
MTPRDKRGKRTAEGQQEDTRGAELGAGQASYRTAVAVDGQQQQAVGVSQCRLQVAAGCRCASVHEQQQHHQAKVHVLQCMSSRSCNRL